MLRDLQHRIRYNTAEHNLVKEFYVPCLAASQVYKRAVGFFTSFGLSVASRGVASLIANDGKMYLVASPNLTTEDIEAINQGYEDRNAIIQHAIKREFENIYDLVARRRLEALAWMIANNTLEIRIAFKGAATVSAGLFHEKGGVFADASGDRIAFSGSGNESLGGWDSNYETLNTYRSWDQTAVYVDEIERDFDRLWDNCYPGLTVINFTDVARSLLRPYCPARKPKEDTGEHNRTMSRDANFKATRELPGLPTGLTLRPYQVEAIRNWFGAGGKGVFKLATGAGKTITALALSTNLVLKKLSNSIIIVAPYIHLVKQWEEEACKFKFCPISIFGSASIWQNRLDDALASLDSNSPPLFVVCTNDGFRGQRFQSLLPRLPSNTLIIADEVHNIGSGANHKNLPVGFKYRLGLSATPERHGDEGGTSKILEYFGEILEPQYSLDQALIDGVLCPYVYNILRVDLTDEEDDRFCDLSLKIARFSGRNNQDAKSSEILKNLLIKRARIVSNAAQKVDQLIKSASDFKDDGHILVYCGSGQADDLDDENTKRNIDNVCFRLAHELGMRVASFTYETEFEMRGCLLDALDEGSIQALVAIRCLDEGVDLPSIKTAFIMASTANPRQFIQRRGRLLRRHPGKKRATIFDFLVLPQVGSATDASIKSLVRKELLRAFEFARLSQNSGQACSLIGKLGKEYGVSVFDEKGSQ